MTLKSPEFFAEQFLPTLNRLTSFTQTARALNFDESTPHVWLRESKAAMKRGDDPSDYLFEYDGTKRYLHQHVKSVQRASISDIEANARARARDGYFRPCRFQGKLVWREDPKLVGFSDAVLDMLGYPDRLLRINGELQPEMEWVPPSTDLVIAVLQSNSETYRRRSSVDVSMNARVSGGVMVLGGARQTAQVAAPLPVLEVIADEIAEPATAMTDISVSDTPPDELPDDDIGEPLPSSPVPQVIREPAPSIYDPRPGPNPLVRPGGNRPLTDVEKAVLARLPSSLNRAR